MLSILEKIPNLGMNPLQYVFKVLNFPHKPDTLWLEFGVASGYTINTISCFTKDTVYGFDSFEGLPEDWRDGFEKGHFTRFGFLPVVRPNVSLIKGWFSNTLPQFLQKQNKKISFIHMDADLYSSTKFVLDTVKDYIDDHCIIVFDELVNYVGFDGEKGELKAFYEFVTENNVKYEWIGMKGTVSLAGAPDANSGENVAVIIFSIGV
jgi:hypothetical protein